MEQTGGRDGGRTTHLTWERDVLGIRRPGRIQLWWRREELNHPTAGAREASQRVLALYNDAIKWSPRKFATLRPAA